MTETQKRNDTFSDRLKVLIEERKKNGQTLRELAKDLDVSLGVLSDWQNGNKTPRGDSIIKLAQYFEVSADYLLGLTDARTVDTDLRTVAEYTGLSEKAITELKHSIPQYVLDIISDMTEQGILLQLAWKVYDFGEAARGAVAWENHIKSILKLAKETSDIEYYKQIYREAGHFSGLHDKMFEWFAEIGEHPSYLGIEDVFQNDELFKKYREYVDSLTIDQIAESSDMVISIIKDLDLLEYQATRFLTLPMDELARSCGIDDMKRISVRSAHDFIDELRNQTTAIAERALDSAGNSPEDTAPKKD